MGVMPSPITGSAGNVEFLVHARTPLAGRRRPAIDRGRPVEAMVDGAVAEAHDHEPRG